MDEIFVTLAVALLAMLDRSSTDGQCGGTDNVRSGALNALTLVKAIDLQIFQLEIVVGVRHCPMSRKGKRSGSI